MKRAVLILALVVLSGSLVFGDVTFHLYVEGTANNGMDIGPGDTANLWVQLYADAGEAVSGVAYDVQLPEEGWTLESREYSDYGWFEDDGFWDGSNPPASGTPLVINNDTYTGGDANTADFWFNTQRNPFGSTVTNWATCEVFSLTVPSDTPLDLYTIALANTYAYDIGGGEFTSSGEDFGMNVTPEPASMALLLIGVGALAARRRRRS